MKHPRSFFVVIFSLIAFVVHAQHSVKHIVIFKYKSTATQAQIDEIGKAFKSLKDKIPGIISFESGVNDSPEKLNNGFTHIYLLTFANVEARNGYLPHPEHDKFKALVGKLGILEEPFVVDFVE